MAIFMFIFIFIFMKDLQLKVILGLQLAFFWH